MFEDAEETSERCPVSSRPELYDRPITMVTRVYSCTAEFDRTDFDTQTNTGRANASRREKTLAIRQGDFTAASLFKMSESHV